MRFGSGDLPPIKTTFNRLHWLDIAEYVATAGSAVGTVVAIAGQHIAYATAPLSLAIALNLTNRQRLAWHHKQENLLLKAHITNCYEDLSGQFPREMYSDRVNLSEIHTDVNFSEIQEQIHDLHDSLNILENKSASLATKVYQNLSVELDAIRQQIANFSEPFDITNLENEIESLYAQIAAFANQPVIDLQHYEKFYQTFQDLDNKNREVILPCLKLLVKDVKDLQKDNLTTSSKLENLTQKFIARSETAQLSKVKRVVLQLRESVTQLQQTEVIADLLKSIDKLQADLNLLTVKFNHRPEAQTIQKLELLVTMLVTSVTHLKRVSKDEETVNVLNQLQKSLTSQLKKP